MVEDLRAIEESVASEEMQSTENLDDLTYWFYQFGDLRVRQIEELIKEYKGNELMIARCQLAIDNIRALQSMYKPV